MDAKTFAERYGQIYQDLYRFALCMMKHPHDAEDAVGEAVLSAFESAHRLRQEEAFKSWMFAIVANTCRRKLRGASRVETHDPETLASAAEAASERGESAPSALDHADAMAVREALDGLAEDDRLIVALSVFGGYNSQEIGLMFDMNPNTVRSRRKRALERMATMLKDVA